jgi:hemerythrin-like domain-containing protein
MALAHNMFIRALNSVYLQAPVIREPEDVSDLFIYCNTWISMIEHHHKLEETHLFSSIETSSHDPKIVATEREQHRAIHEGLDRLQKYIDETAPEDYKWEDLKIVIDSFGDVLKTHLAKEVETLANLKDSSIPEDEIAKAWKITEKAAQGVINSTTTVRNSPSTCSEY